MEEEEAKERQRLNLFVAADVHHKLKIEAAVRGVSMTSLVEQALSEWLEQEAVYSGGTNEEAAG